MRIRISLIFCPLFLLGLSVLLHAQEITTWGPKKRTVQYGFRIMNPTSKPAMKIDVYLPLPLESPRQEIHFLHYSEQGLKRVFTDVHGQKLVHYAFDRLEAGEWVELGFTAGVTVKNLCWEDPEVYVSRESPVLTREERERYLIPETNYSMESELMRRTAEELAWDAASEFETLVRIHDHVTSKIRYVRDNQWDPAAMVLARGTGSCSEYNYVLSGLCRLAGLPTRCVGGSTNGFRALPTTDAVFHRWTEVFITGLGWFPVDCSRDANPLRGKRSHFGRNYVDVLVWCRQAGGDEDSLGWDYRANARVTGDDPGVRKNHRTRWFPFYPEKEIEAAYAWLSSDSGARPEPDLLECALLHWQKTTLENRVRLINALAETGRNVCIRWAAGLPEDGQMRETFVKSLCDSEELANTILERSCKLFRFRSWYRSNESKLVPGKDGRFRLVQSTGAAEVPVTTASSSEIWAGLAAEVVSRLGKDQGVEEGKTVVVTPVVDQTLVGLGGRGETIHASLEALVSRGLKLKLVDEESFDRRMEDQGLGKGEYWALANRDGVDQAGSGSSDTWPELILVPICITERSVKSKGVVLYHLELKVLELKRIRYFKVLAQVNRKADEEPLSDRGLLVAGGDTVLARWEHDMVGRNGYDWPLAGVEPVLSSADAALCNLECCVSLKGEPTDKDERCSFYYRARPEMLRVLTRAGIDIVTGANNHGGDYGPVSVADTAMWCKKAGLVCTGIGGNPAEAEAPRLVRIGPVRVGIAGMDFTTPCFRAGDDSPGTSHANEKDDLVTFTEKMGRLGQWANGRCDLLVLTIHWGNNWVRETQPVHRKMARIAFKHGVDLILGHSAHRLQGIEEVNGKVAVYDMGNLLFDCDLKPEGKMSALFRLHLSAAGVHKIEVIPARALNGHTVLAGWEEAKAILSEMDTLCTALGTALSIREDVEGRPVGVIEILKPKATPRDPADPELACAVFPAKGEEIQPAVSEEARAAGIPGDASKVNPPVELAPGVELLAFRLQGTATEGGILFLSTWWRVTGQVGRHVLPAYLIDPGGETPRRGTPWYTRHDAGDWTVPLHLLKPGEMVKDFYPARLAGLPAGPCKVYAVAIDTTRPEGKRILGEPCFLGNVEILPREEK